MKALYLACAALAVAQSPPLEVRGTVIEGGLGLAGATVTLYEFGHEPAQATTRTVFATTFTDSKGEFTFHPVRVGEYYVEVQKAGYFAETFNGPSADPIDSTGDPVHLNQEHPSQERRFTLMRLGEVRGRVIDEDGKPLANLNLVVVASATSALRASARVVTDQDGYFAATKLRPGEYLVRIVPQHSSLEILLQFSEDDLKIVDQDLESSLWPSTPLPVSSGASLSVGTITAHKAPYYRAHVSVPSGDCAPGEKWTFSITSPGFGPSVPCGKDFMVPNLAPGSYTFSLVTGVGEKRSSTTTPVEVTDRNIEVSMSLSSGVDISGRIVTTDGSPLSPSGRIGIGVGPAGAPLGGSQIAQPGPGGKFLIQGVSGGRQQVAIAGLASNFYVKEVLYNGLMLADGVFTAIPGSPGLLEIIIDDQAATISGSVARRDSVSGSVMVFAVKWPISTPDPSMPILLARTSTAADDQGRFEISGLAPGEYRILAVSQDSILRAPPDILTRAEKVTLERGGSQSISLKIAEP